MKKYTVKSPGKINIGLRVLSIRKDGYHNIETIFYPINLTDKITVSVKQTKKSKIKVSVFPRDKYYGLNNYNNICFKAAELFLKRFKIRKTYSIYIKINKSIPAGAGLGGGSSNAAGVLKVLSKHFRKSKFKHILNSIALQLGSDVPFFLYGKPAYAYGRGEKLVPLPGFKVPYNIKVVNPGINISTGWAYKQLSNTINELSKKTKSLKSKTFRISEKNKFVNIFENVVFKKYPAVKKLKQEMYNKGAVFASMSGSGSSVYGFFR